jgi:LysR family transcriptional regulator, transcriptional activator of nhaA
VKRQYQVEQIGHLGDVRIHFYAITLERKLTHPLVMVISQAAKEGLLAMNGAP